VNTEELEQSLRAEFEGYLKNVLGEMRRDVSDLQQKFEGEFEKHKSQMDEAFRSLSGRFDTAVEFDRGFTETVTEHLRLARDEGAQITATALGEAEKLGSESTRGEFEKLRNGINDIKSHNTQAAILSSLVAAASGFATRGAFFILKNDHLVGWKVFGKGQLVDEDTVRSVHFPVASDTLLSNSINSLLLKGAGSADREDNARFLDPLRFGDPERMFAIPLSARGRGVAVLYVDGGDGNESVNLDALETLVSVAGLTVELLASGGAPAAVESYQRPEPVGEPTIEAAPEAPEPSPSVQESVVEAVDESAPEPEYFGEVAVAAEELSEASSHVEPSQVETVEPVAEETVTEFSEPENVATESEPTTTDFAFAPDNFSDSPKASNEEVTYEPAETVQHDIEEPAAEVPAEFEPEAAEQPAPRQRYRTVDLPIEVADDERRSHSDARRFARLLVSEIRLYNEQKVVEGREAGEIYESLKEAIDRSREMYDKRVLPEVASRFDYFHYELVNNLADGDEEKLGASYMAVKV